MQKKYKSMVPVLLYVAGAFLCLFILTNKYPPKKCCSHDHGHSHAGTHNHDDSTAAPVAETTVSDGALVKKKTTFKVTLKDFGSEKIQVIKILRQVIPNLSLSDAKKLTENTPSVIAKSTSKDDADKMIKKLKAVGATAEKKMIITAEPAEIFVKSLADLSRQGVRAHT